MTTMRTSIHGRRFGLGVDDQLVSNEIEISSPAVDAVIAIAASQTSPRVVTVQLKTANGNLISVIKSIEFLLFADALGAGFAATGGSTGIADDTTAGASLALVAKKVFKVQTNAAGLWSGTWTDTAHEVAYLGVKLPSGRVVISAPLTTA
jgi:hypothetical protein